MRARDTSRFGIGLLYPNLESFLSEPPRSGLHTIQIGDRFLDLLIRNRGADTTFVTFQHRISVRTPYPKLVGDGFVGELGANLVAISDPGVVTSNDVRLAWYLGDRATGPLKDHLLPVIFHVLWSIGQERYVFFGTSGGGYAAMDYGSEFDDAVIFTVNPRLGFTRPGQETRDLKIYIEHCHAPKGRTPYERIKRKYAKNLAETVPPNANFYGFMYHNIGDAAYLKSNQEDFINARRNDLKLYQRLDFDGEGHVPIPGDKLRRIAGTIANANLSIEEAALRAGFTM
ncbi:hypothetical protein [Corynebacterium sp. HMSC071B10]|uniref:hypothetical protein n=1 Tax=Corynebacterium sp. HMSC071B10 TaxID=1739494 RepID=UPI00114CED13|nr:hypothetical protein [Corynebacterium sp. HMSC071B10]